MKWPLQPEPISQVKTPFFNLVYLNARGQGGPDSTIMWTSEIPWQPLHGYIAKFNRHSDTLAGTTHLLVQAVGQALARHPSLNCRVLGRKVYRFRKTNVCLATRLPHKDEVNLVLIEDADRLPLGAISKAVWHAQIDYRRNQNPVIRDRDRLRRLPSWAFRYSLWFFQWLEKIISLPIICRLDRFRSSPVLVNDFSHHRFPIMRGYKPSRMPDESKSLSVTLGPAEEKVVWRDGVSVPLRVAPICIRVDHRICDGYQLSQFVSTLVNLLSNPEELESYSQHSTTEPSEHQVSLGKKREAA